MRVSGKNALIQLKRGAGGTPFDISGLSSDGRSRANEFAFKIEGNIVDAVGYNEDWEEAIPTGQSRWSGSLKVFYNVTTGEVNEYLWTMYEEQHMPASCTDVQDYTIYIFPEGDCTGKEKWTGTRAVVESLDIQIPLKEIMTIDAPFRGWQMSRAIVV